MTDSRKNSFSFEKTINKEEEALQQLRNELTSINVAEPRLEIEQLASELGTLEKKAARLDAEESACRARAGAGRVEIETMVTQKAACEAELNALLPAISSKASKASLFSEKIKLLQENLTTLETRHHLFGREVQARQNRYKDALLDLEKLSFNIAACAENRRSLLDEINKLKH